MAVLMTRDFYIGLILAISSSIFIGSSFIVKKKGLMKLSVRAGNGGYGYLKEWLWWAGLILMGIGEAANFVAYAFAPATLVTPLGALSVLFSSFLASRFLKEKLNVVGKVGCLVCLLGSTFVVLHSPKEQEVKSLQELEGRLADPGFIAYVVVVLVLSMFLIFYVGPRHGTGNPLVYVTVTGTIGSLSVMGCKGLGTGIKQIVAGDTSLLGNWLPWMLLVCVVVFISIQMVYLNRALDLFNTAVVTPMLYVVFTGCVILASGILFKEWSTLCAEDIIGNLCGFFTIISGIFLLQAFKDLNVSIPNLVSKLKREEAPPIPRYPSNGSLKSYRMSSHDLSNDEETSSLMRESEGSWKVSMDGISQNGETRVFAPQDPYYYSRNGVNPQL